MIIKGGTVLSIWKAALLGVLQGATEFLPVSSSGHLVVVQQLFGWKASNEVILAFDIALHLGTLVSVVAVFWHDLLDMLTGRNMKLVAYLLLATLPAVIIGFTFKDWIEGLFSSIRTVGVAWIVTGVVLLLTRFAPSRDRTDVGWFRSLLIGSAQAIAVIPGVSRSGSTIVAGLFLGLERVYAARFAFLMSVPAIAGSAFLDAEELAGFPADATASLIVGFIAAAVVGYICIKWLLKIISGGKLWWFGAYCLLIGIITTVLLWGGR